MGSAAARAVPRRATLHSVAAAAGVSHQTVSNVLNAPDRVRPETRALVLQAINAVGYRPDEAGRALARRSSRLVSFHGGVERHDRVSMLDDFARALARWVSRTATASSSTWPAGTTPSRSRRSRT